MSGFDAHLGSDLVGRRAEEDAALHICSAKDCVVGREAWIKDFFFSFGKVINKEACDNL